MSGRFDEYDAFLEDVHSNSTKKVELKIAQPATRTCGSYTYYSSCIDNEVGGSANNNLQSVYFFRFFK